MALASSMLLLSLQSCKEEGIIEEDAMAQIYAEMLLTDQWINTTPGMRMIADTSLVYEPILKKFGHTSADYRKSVEYYLNDPDTYADIMKKTVKILDGQLSDLHKRKAEIEEDKVRQQFVRKMTREVKLSDSLFAVNHIHEDCFGPDDSLSVEWDSLSLCYHIMRVKKQVKIDTLAPVDTMVPPVDSLVPLELDTLQRELKVNDEVLKQLKKTAPLKVSDSLFVKKSL
jgi:hypothetical protein